MDARQMAVPFCASLAIAGALFAAASTAGARDFGVMGQTWGIAEPDLLSTIQGRLAAMSANGGVERVQRDLTTRAAARVRRPEPVHGLNAATEPRRWAYDPSIVVEADVRDQQGRLIAARGTRVNPLDTITLTQVLVFLDGDDATQVDWAMKRWPSAKAKLILVAGSPFDLMKTRQRRFFFDQQGAITSKFGIVHLPAVVRAAGRQLVIEEVVLPRAASGGATS